MGKVKPARDLHCGPGKPWLPISFTTSVISRPGRASCTRRGEAGPPAYVQPAARCLAFLRSQPQNSVLSPCRYGWMCVCGWAEASGCGKALGQR